MSSRSIKLAKTWKKKEIEKLIKTKNEMIEFNVDTELITDFIEKERIRINEVYNQKLDKHKLTNNNSKKKKEIDLLLKDKQYLEKSGMTEEQINNYIEKQIEKINLKYLSEQIDFID